MSDTEHLSRNPGPRWGFQFLCQAQRIAPRWLLRPLLMLGTWVAVAAMPLQRRHSRAYLTVVLGRAPSASEVWRHFFAFLEFFMLRLRCADGIPPRCELAPENAAAFEALIASEEPAFFGTFHFGHSDLLGFLLPARGRRVAMIRLRVGNSPDTEMFARRLGGAVSFIWVNEPDQLLFALKAAVERGDSLAMQCDRADFSAKTEGFRFLGATRSFPFTIYHLAIMFGRPVVFCLGLPEGVAGTRIVASPVFRPDAALGREENLRRACDHFQAVVTRLETLVRQHPHLWFNFLPLNPETGPSRASVTQNSLPS